MNNDIRILGASLEKYTNSKIISCIRCMRGVAAKNYKVNFESGLTLLVRFDERRDLSEARLDNVMMSVADKHGTLVPCCYDSWRLSGGVVSVRPWIEGDALIDVSSRDGILECLGQTLAHIHNSRPSESLMDRRHFFYLPFYERSDATEKLLEEALQVLRRYPNIVNLVALAIQISSEKVRAGLPFSPIGLVHGDFSPSNIIRSNGKIYVIDWEKSCVGPIYSDIAQALYYFAPIMNLNKKSSFNMFIDAYRSVREIEDYNALEEWLYLHPLHIFLHDSVRTMVKLKSNESDHFDYFCNESAPRFKHYVELNGWG